MRDYHWNKRLREDEVLKFIKQAKVGMTIYIATDEPNHESVGRVAVLARLEGYKVVTLNTFAYAFNQFDELALYAPFIDQIVLSHAYRFLPTISSTFSDAILLNRIHMNAHDAEEELRRFDCKSELKVSPYYRDCLCILNGAC